MSTTEGVGAAEGMGVRASKPDLPLFGPVLVRPASRPVRIVESVRLPALWLIVALLLAGAVRVGQLLADGFARYPLASAVAVVLFTLYAVPFWLLVRSLDYLEREPPLLLGSALAWGALVATSTAISGGGALHDILAKVVSPQFSAEWGPALAAPAVEEIAKTLGLVAIALVARAQVNSVLDGVVYGAMVGLGFQVVEDVVYAVSAVGLAGGGDQIGPVVTTFFLRGFLAGLWSHTLFSALAGAGIGYLFIRIDRPLWSRLGVGAGGLLGAWSCHFLWNSPLLADGFGYGGWGVLAGLVIKGAPPLVAISLVVRAVRRREGAYYAARLAALDDPLIATPDEVRVLGVGRLRAQARRYAYAQAGRRASRALGRLQSAQARLAVALSRPEGANSASSAGRSAEVDHWRDMVLALRGELVDAGHPCGVAPPECRSAVWDWLNRLVATTAVVGAVAAVWAAIRALGGG